MQSVLEKFTSNFLIAAFIPALGFVLICLLFFGPLVPPDLQARIPSTFEVTFENSLFLVVMATILGFILSSLNTFIYRLLEGYTVLERYFPSALKQQVQRAKSLQENIAEKEAAWIEADDNDESRSTVHQLRSEHRYLVSLYEYSYPKEEHQVLPTRFGNIMRAAEYYPNTRYGIDGVVMWPRLVHVIPRDYFTRIEQSNNNLSFLINCTTLSLVFMLLCLLASFYQLGTYDFATGRAGRLTDEKIAQLSTLYYATVISQAQELDSLQMQATVQSTMIARVPGVATAEAATASAQIASLATRVSENVDPTAQAHAQSTVVAQAEAKVAQETASVIYFVPISLSQESRRIYLQRSILYLITAGLSVFTSWLFYRASLQLVTQYGNMIRSAYDLFRFDLLKQLRLKLPENSEEEYDRWRKVSKFMVMGREAIYFDYIHEKEEKPAEADQTEPDSPNSA